MNNLTDFNNFVNNYYNGDYLYPMNNNYNMNNSKYNSTNDFEEGFLRGNIFNDLYVPYKNYKPINITANNEEDYYMLMIQVNDFIAHELTLYLDVYPNDNNAIMLRDKYITDALSAKNEYEKKYGPISLDSPLLDKSPWMWDTNRWPWEVYK